MVSRFEHFSASISCIYRYIQRIERTEMEKYGLKGPYAQCLLAMRRYPEGITAARLCEVCDKDKAAISRMMVELEEKKDSMIKALSGGQRKRASIAVELLSDPNLLFLDEPASGLDPGTERNLMQSLREMADGGKTVILVTHSTLQLQLCDKINTNVVECFSIGF